MLSALIQRADDESDPDHQYGYVPQEAITILFVALFATSTMLHLGQAVYFKTWWLLPTAVLCGIGEVIGWSARVWSSINPFSDTPFLMQISTIIISPTPLLAANFIIMARIIQILGPSYSRLAPRWFTMVFLPCDIIALVVQGAGGGIASSADDKAGAALGANIMLGGIVFQFVVIIVFSCLAGEFLQRYLQDRPLRQSQSTTQRGVLTRHLKLMLSALAFSCVLLFIRSIYRIIELSGGWDGRIIRTEVYFNVLDGAMIILAIYTMNVVHPGFFLKDTVSRYPNRIGGTSEMELVSDSKAHAV
ncbi:RTA1-domain-containing protein [Roridomyces roridus]|uniref:RTA1-domain-containing protein n=1 Tax=Roridomyces roridus TaxID=1738132 RepID=A0AAD7AZ18_9AGAR|nr:RTA1-domain-containing protein [Roridomyces roridus]